MPGISGFALYVPPHRVALEQWCQWRDQPWEKIRNVIGESFRVCGAEQDVYCMAATAVLRLIDAYDIDPGLVGQLILGTESASDNAAGAVIVRGMIDDVLVQRGQPALARDCEVPEIKHACLGGVYGLKQAVRYLSTDGVHRYAIVVSADIAEYAPGSSGEPTQGAGAVAMLLESQPRLLEIDLADACGSSCYRTLDFRKPFARFAGQSAHGARLTDYPVFNGRYSTACYFDTMRHAMDKLQTGRGKGWLDALSAWDAVYLHRPYARMPETALGMLWLHALAVEDHPRFYALCELSDLNPNIVRDELASAPTIDGQPESDAEHYPLVQIVMRRWRQEPDYSERITGALGPGLETMRNLGNLYTAALPAWLAAGLDAAVNEGLEISHSHWLVGGYGSGDAAELLPMRVMPDWQLAARNINVQHALAGSIGLDAESYEAVHSGGPNGSGIDCPHDAFVIESVGQRRDEGFDDFGIARYRFADAI